MVRFSVVALAFALLVGGCGPAVSTTGESRYPRSSDLAPTGHRCRGGQCVCRPLIGGDQEEERPAASGTKRYEVRIPVSVHSVWVHIDGKGTFYKPAEIGTDACVYVDLAPGEHRVTYVVEERERGGGFPAVVRVNEYGRKSRAWYEAFLFDCGTADGACRKPEVEAWMQEAQTQKGHVDACSSSRFLDVRWNANEHEGGKLRNLTVSFTLKVYKFEPTRAPKTRCQGRLSPNGEPADEGSPELQ
jgi:hypothetical protein